jgi:hypothetical protein
MADPFHPQLHPPGEATRDVRRNSDCTDHISVLANLEELMDIRFRKTESLAEVITNHSYYLGCRDPRREQRRRSNGGLD